MNRKQLIWGVSGALALLAFVYQIPDMRRYWKIERM